MCTGFDVRSRASPAFFPGGRGFAGPDFPCRPVMILGHNFDTEENFKASVLLGYEGNPKAKTWPNLRTHLLPNAGPLTEESCFFTNVYLGAIAATTSHNATEEKTRKKGNTGPFPCSAEYKAACVKALPEQIAIVRPRVIALLGGYVPALFAAAYPSYKSLAEGSLTRRQSHHPFGGFRLQYSSGHYAQVVSLAHPSNPRSNESHIAQGEVLGAALRRIGD